MKKKRSANGSEYSAVLCICIKGHLVDERETTT